MVDLADRPPTIATAGADRQDLAHTRLRMAVVCMAGAALGASILPFCAVGAALGPMMLEFGWGADKVSLAYAVLMWAGALGVWPVGVLIDRYGARLVVTAGAASIGLVSLMLPLVGHFWQFCILVALLGAFGSVGLGYSRIVAWLFGVRRGLAMGVFAAEGSLLGVVMPMVMTRLMVEGGWRGAFTVLGLGVLFLAPLIYLGLADRRAPASWPPRWAPPSADPAEGMTAVQAARDPAFWVIIAAGLVTAAIGGGVWTSFQPALAAKGFAQSTVFNAAPITLMAALAGAICSGLVLDRSRSPKVAAWIYLATAVAYLLWVLVTPRFGGEPMLIVGLAIGAFAFTAQLPLVGYFFSRYFGLKSFATVFGLQIFLQTLAVGFATSAVGRAVGLIGDYRLVFVAGIGAQLVAALLYFLLPKYRYAAVGEADGPPEDIPRAVARR